MRARVQTVSFFLVKAGAHLWVWNKHDVCEKLVVYDCARSLITEDGGDERGSVIGDRQHDENKSAE